MSFKLARRGLLATALALSLVPCIARATESASYTAYFQGRYLTALKLAEQEAAQGSKEAYTLMGQIYEEGLGVAQDFGKAADSYAKAADLGDANAQFSLGTLVAEGHGVKKDLRIAADLFERAAQAGNPSAQYNLALIYLNGKGRPQDEAKAAEWMQKSASLGNPQAQYDLSAFYQFGRGVPIDKAKAAEWLGRAADGGLPDAQVEYGIMLFKGEGVPVDQARAAKLFRQAAEQGNPVAQNRLARLYANGVVVKEDSVQAAKWHLLARSAGVSDFTLDLMLAYFHPTVAGVLTPLLVLVGAGLIPYVDRGNLTATRPSERKTAVVLFTMFCALGLILTFVGIFFRGPGYSFVIPYLPFFENTSPGLHFSL